MDLQGDAGATQRSRTADSLITPSFEAIWPDVERRLRALLYRRGLDQPSADDVVQEVALRILVGRVTFTSAKDLLRWAGPVACNLHVDLLRQRAKLHDGAVGDRPAANDVAGEVADRIELQRAFRGIAALRPADREAIMDAVAAEPAVPRTRKEAVRLAVRRHRARSRLALVMEQLAAWLGGFAVLRRSRRTAVAALAIVPAALPLVLGLPVPGDAHGDSVATRPVTPVTRPAPYRAEVVERAPVAAPAQAAAVRPAARRPRPTASATPDPVVDIEGPNGSRVRAGGDHRRPDDKTVCVGLPYLPRVCV